MTRWWQWWNSLVGMYIIGHNKERARLSFRSPLELPYLTAACSYSYFFSFSFFFFTKPYKFLCCVNGRRKTAFFFPPSVIYLSLVSKRGPLPLLPSLPSLFPILVHELIVKMMKQFPSHPCEWVFVLFPLYHRFLQNGRFSLRDTRYHMIYFFLVKIERHRHLAIRLNSQVSR